MPFDPFHQVVLMRLRLISLGEASAFGIRSVAEFISSPKLRQFTRSLAQLRTGIAKRAGRAERLLCAEQPPGS